MCGQGGLGTSPTCLHIARSEIPRLPHHEAAYLALSWLPEEVNTALVKTGMLYIHRNTVRETKTYATCPGLELQRSERRQTSLHTNLDVMLGQV